MQVKICGITSVEDCLAAIRAGADAIGLNFVPGSPRALDEVRAKEIAASPMISWASSSRPRQASRTGIRCTGQP